MIGRPRRRRLAAAACVCVIAGFVAAPPRAAAPVRDFDPEVWRRAFARPPAVPSPVDNPTTPEKVALGRRLFEDTRLSGDGTLSCATCHDPALSFSDGVALRRGHDGEPLPRRTPSLWNVAWGLTFFWDGRATSLEAQAGDPIENAREMAGNLPKAAAAFADDPEMARGFASAFPDPRVTVANIRAALASFERTLVSPETRFDRWAAGDANALEPDEIAGLKLFVGKGGCVNCHSGWRFTDDAFHDIGLPSTDRGRGETINLPAADHAFKTPSLRERAWTAPYMHNGSLKTLEEVVNHYADGIVRRPTLSADLPPRIELSPEERAQLVAFLGTLSSEDPPRPQSLPPRVQEIGAAGTGKAIPTTTVSERDREFKPGHVLIQRGQSLTVVNDDTRVHNVRIDDPRARFSSDAQEPGDKVVIGLDQTGEFTAICGIHPNMRLDIVVTDGPAP